MNTPITSAEKICQTLNSQSKPGAKSYIHTLKPQARTGCDADCAFNQRFPKLLLHICCAPDATIPWPQLLEEGYETVGYFYGGNIHPREEYERRAEAVEILSKNTNAPAYMADIPASEWLSAVSGLENEPEGGARCKKCFELQLDAAAKYAAANGFSHISTTLTISPHKNVALINEIGVDCAKKHGLIWVERVWRKNNGFKRSVDASRAMGLYRQNYCGCTFSIRSGAQTVNRGDTDDRKQQR